MCEIWREIRERRRLYIIREEFWKIFLQIMNKLYSDD